jgi:hypothetical protein
MTVDTYAVQHPGRPSPQSIRSVALHLLSLCVALEPGARTRKAIETFQDLAASNARFIWLPPPASLGSLTVADVRAASTSEEHGERVRQWARAAWSAWSPHHATVRGWLPHARVV